MSRPQLYILFGLGAALLGFQVTPIDRTSVLLGELGVWLIGCGVVQGIQQKQK